VEIVGVKSDPALVTGDVSRGGVFVKTETPKSVRNLLRLRIRYSQNEEPIEVHGMVVHVTSHETAMQTGEAPGMGIEFIAFGGAPREHWEAFLRQLSATPSGTFAHGGPAPRAAAPSHQSGIFSQSGTFPPGQFPGSASPIPQMSGQAAVAPAPQQVPQASPRKKLVRTVFPVPVQAVDQLYSIYEQELVEGVMFVYTPERLNIGDRVALRIIHPANGQEYDLHGKVQQVHVDPQYPGLSIALRPSTIARREKFRAFIEEGLPEEEVPFDLIEE